MRVLAVDDDEDFRVALETILGKADCEVVITGSVAKFKRVYPEFLPTVVLLDIFMPECDGFELVNWLGEQNCPARIVVLSGHDRHYRRMMEEFCIVRGLSDVTTVAKPVSRAELFAALGVRPHEV